MTTELVAVAYTPEQVDLIKRTVCNGASNDELALFIQQCQRTGLDPFARQIHAVRRGGKMTIQVGIDGFRLIADRTGQSDGQEGPFWCGPDGVWKDVWLETASKPAACKVIVFRKGHSRGYTGIARWAEFYQSAGGMWDKLPTTMIAKVAESIALRKGFPQELSGLYSPEELDQSGHDVSPAVQQVPPALPPKKADPLAVARYSERFARCPSEPARQAILNDMKEAKERGDLTEEQINQLRPVAKDTFNRLQGTAKSPGGQHEPPKTVSHDHEDDEAEYDQADGVIPI